MGVLEDGSSIWSLILVEPPWFVVVVVFVGGVGMLLFSHFFLSF